MKPQTLLLACFLAIFATLGCGSSSRSSDIQKADNLAMSDPDAKARQLLQQFNEAEDKQTWVTQNTFALTVFDKVTDAQLKSDYQANIAPLMGVSKK